LGIPPKVSKSKLNEPLDAMPILTRDKKVTQQQIIGFECSRCKTIYYDDLYPFEMQEMLHWRNVGGYGSVWGEGNQVEIDLCQRCTRELLEPFATIHAATTGT